MANQEGTRPLVKRVLKPILDQLTQGAEPSRLALAATLGGLIGLIPILGISTGLGIAVASIFRLNHVVFQSINYLVYPLQLVLFPVFLKLGGKILGGEVMEFDMNLLRAEFSASIPDFLSKYGVIGAKATFIWLLASVLVGIPLYLGLRF
ncbi:DUF2062 domain-containing protein, partial [bacterium]|nr:DUF2062 domain-containing protein [bacterium]